LTKETASNTEGYRLGEVTSGEVENAKNSESESSNYLHECLQGCLQLDPFPLLVLSSEKGFGKRCASPPAGVDT
jgi:hypothetical protein